MRRANQVDAAGWTAVADALESLTSLTSLNGYSAYPSIRAGGQTKLALGGTELAVAVARYLPRSADSLTALDLRSPRPARAPSAASRPRCLARPGRCVGAAADGRDLSAVDRIRPAAPRLAQARGESADRSAVGGPCPPARAAEIGAAGIGRAGPCGPAEHASPPAESVGAGRRGRQAWVVGSAQRLWARARDGA